MKKLAISFLLINLLAACASQKPVEPEAAASEPVQVAAPVIDSASTAAVDVDPLNDPANILAQRSVYYPFDVSVVQEADKPAVQAHARYLGQNPSRKVRLEGNADERGSNEYNLALGQRRADGVKKLLMLSGAKASQIEAISYGEEKPKAFGHSEAAWSENRRTDIKY
ncbi:MAG: peptidoglycan-associated lipoprotein Pal [Gallionella sp.]